MSSNSNKQQPAGQGSSPAPHPGAGSRSIRSFSLLVLVSVDFIVAVMMVFSFARFVIDPDPAVKAGPMYVVLALTTSAALLMFLMALNASFFPVMTPQRARDVRLVMWTVGATGVVTGVLTLGGSIQGIVMRLLVATIAFVFIRVQEARLDRARRIGRPEQVVPVDKKTAPKPGSRQRRGGRKR